MNTSILNKTIKPEDVAKLVKSDSDIVISMCASEPQHTLSFLHLAAPRVRDVNVFSCLTMKPYPFFSTEQMQGHFTLCSWFHGPAARAAIAKGLKTVTFVPNMLHRAILDRLCVRKPHIFIGSCTPPDSHGFVSLGPSLVYEQHAVHHCEIVVLEINPNLPRTYGDTQVHVSQVDYFTESELPIPALPIAEPDETESIIGHHIASLVDDGATIQLGIGGIPNAAANSFTEKNDLGVHTELFVDSMKTLFERGNINNRKKSLELDKSICTFALGSKELYPWIDDNLSVEFKQGLWCNDPSVIRQNSKMTSINTCMAIDLTGQIASEGVQGQQYSGTGGQADTAVGAKEGYDGLGKSIIACRSTAKNETLSTIQLGHTPGTPITLHRSHADYFVTEYGIASLRGRSVRERAEQIIAVAHPKFRDQLLYEAKESGLCP